MSKKLSTMEKEQFKLLLFNAVESRSLSDLTFALSLLGQTSSSGQDLDIDLDIDQELEAAHELHAALVLEAKHTQTHPHEVLELPMGVDAASPARVLGAAGRPPNREPPGPVKAAHLQGLDSPAAAAASEQGQESEKGQESTASLEFQEPVGSLGIIKKKLPGRMRRRASLQLLEGGGGGEPVRSQKWQESANQLTAAVAARDRQALEAAVSNAEKSKAQKVELGGDVQPLLVAATALVTTLKQEEDAVRARLVAAVQSRGLPELSEAIAAAEALGMGKSEEGVRARKTRHALLDVETQLEAAIEARNRNQLAAALLAASMLGYRFFRHTSIHTRTHAHTHTHTHTHIITHTHTHTHTHTQRRTSGLCRTVTANA